MKFPLFILVAMLAGAPAAATADPDTVRAEFARVDHDQHGRPRALQLAVVRYLLRDPGTDLSVDLISAVHIGDTAYYAALNQRFRDYDALLYELVIADPGQGESPPIADAGFLSNMQIRMKDALGLAFQLEEIDYLAANFVHADLSAEKLITSMDERGESLYVYFWRLFYAAIEDYARDPLGLQDVQTMSRVLLAPGEDGLKIAIAHEMVKATHSGDFLGDADGSAVIAARNAHAIDILKSQINDGATRIGIFYGAAHMLDFDRRLREELGMRRDSIEWTDAWRFEDAGSDPLRSGK